MKQVLIAASAVLALASSAAAQPAYDAAQGPAPSQYPPCEHKGQDRCMPAGHGGMMHMRHKGHRGHMGHMDHKGEAGEKAKGERG
ncbi:hypothetical protein [Phenylobacterium montanum]|uniref:Uncharacterized protein n=1 Tax=Phenylobacterium montanum TaxID=2823693 RepID=A0A975G2F8_9CAUL|nr:hypothetical protein [Caulobacter sp. S6]QUD89650.1 hypothetical protein KCG34_07185 [Caulobacter sp. S6]